MSLDPNTSDSPFRLDGPLRHIPTLGPLMLSIVERVLAFERLANIHRQASPAATTAEFARRALETLQVRFDLDAEQFALVPAQGGAVVVANHPFGGIEALFLIWKLTSLRRDTTILANHLLMRIPQLHEVLIPVDAFGGKQAAQRNAPSLRRALKHVRRGGLLVIFPAGEVSHLQLPAGRICDPAWSSIAARLIRLSNATVVPMYFSGSNGLVFQMAGLLHPRARTMLLSRELLNKRQQVIPVQVGQPIAPHQVQAIAGDEQLASFLRLSSYALEARTAAPEPIAKNAALAPLATPIGGRRIREEMAALPATQTLARSAELRVVYAQAEQIPWTLRELGRLRELTFRANGEGTGQASDLDRFDPHYTHLILWHEVHAEIAGAYRIGHVDHLVQRFGRGGLYSHTLFDYGPAFISQLGPALELGRSFVRPEYQKTFTALLLLWRGIAQYVAHHPRYRVLFGPVSISANYRPESRALLIDYLRRHHLDPQLNRLVRARKPCKPSASLATLDSDWPHLKDVDTVTSLIERLEGGKGMPILLRQYLKLNGKLAGFNLDSNFGNAIDGLIVVNLTRTDPRALQKYMGSEEAARYLQAQTGSGKITA